MTIGSGLFLSALFLGLVILYVATKDRWNWKRLIKWVIGLPIVLAVIAGLGTWGYVTYQDRPTAQTSFFDIPLGATRADVRFAKGEPSEIASDDPDVWIYKRGTTERPNTSAYVVRFKGDKIRYVQYFSVVDEVNPWLQGFTKGTPYDRVIEVLGQASHTATSKDGLEKILSFDKHNTFYRFEKAEVVTYGIFDSKEGPMEFAPKANNAASSPSSAKP